MAISYSPLRRILEHRKISYNQLRIEIGLHSRTTERLRNDSGYVPLQTIDLLCEYLDVPIEHIIEYKKS